MIHRIKVIGPSTTQLFTNLSLALSLPPHSELIVSQIDHEANISPCVRLAKMQGHIVKWWTPSNASNADADGMKRNVGGNELMLTPENLRPLLSEKTKLVCCTHTSNVLGGIHDIKAIAEEVHSVPGAMLCVDGVAYAPHNAPNVKALGVDFYSFSWYKVRRMARGFPGSQDYAGFMLKLTKSRSMGHTLRFFMHLRKQGQRSVPLVTISTPMTPWLRSWGSLLQAMSLWLLFRV